MSAGRVVGRDGEEEAFAAVVVVDGDAEAGGEDFGESEGPFGESEVEHVGYRGEGHEHVVVGGDRGVEDGGCADDLPCGG